MNGHQCCIIESVSGATQKSLPSSTGDAPDRAARVVVHGDEHEAADVNLAAVHQQRPLDVLLHDPPRLLAPVPEQELWSERYPLGAKLVSMFPSVRSFRVKTT